MPYSKKIMEDNIEISDSISPLKMSNTWLKK